MRPGWVSIGALWGVLGVGLGAFGAHMVEGSASAQEYGWWVTAAQYHLLHAPVIVAVGLLQGQRKTRAGRAPGDAAGWALLLGSLVFSGTLYAMALGAPRWLGAVTPLGGVGLMAGWLLLAWAARDGAARDGGARDGGARDGAARDGGAEDG